MADVNANIDINIDSSNALAQLKTLQRQISQFHTSIAKSSEAAALAQKGLQKNLLNSINAINGFTAEMRTVKTSAESFTDSLEKNKFSMREYFRYAGASTKTFGRLFKSEFDTIGKVAEERVKRLQTQYIKMGRDTNGAMKAMGIMPTQLNMSDYTTKVQIAAQKQALFNQLMKQGSTNLLNFGKNTQWAGRQLMVGFTLPLMLVGSTAAKAFMDMEAQALKFKKVYGDLFTPQEETQQVLDNITELGKQFTKYGVAVSATVGLASEAAAAGFQGLDLQRQTTEATRLSILGQIDGQKALETTISLQNAFGMSSEKLADSINFLNAVENQTVVSLDDITTAIPKVAPVIQQLGGDVKDLTFFIAAMKEGGINASEGANALKSGLAALINPTGKASAMLEIFGINAKKIVTDNKGNLKATVVEFATALNQLDPLNRAQAIEQMFGKFQFARLSTLFANVAKDGNQAARVLDLANSSVEELSSLSEKELGMTADSAMNKFKKSVEDLKFALIPVGQAFLEAATPIIEFVGNILEKFANLSNGTKKLITLLTVGIGAVGPVLLMTFGLLANGVANIIKLFLTLRGGYQRLTGQTNILGEQTQYMTMEQLDAAAAAHSLNQTHAKLTQTFTAERTAVNQLISAYNSAAGASRNFAMNNPGMMMPGKGARKFASGIVSVPGPKGAGDIVPAMLSPGEAVVPSDMAKKYAPLIQGMVAGNIPGYQGGRETSSAKGMVFAHGSSGRNLIQEEIQELSSSVPQSIKRNLAEATRVKAFTNYGFVAPEKLNKGKMSGAESGQFFEQNAELATSRIYKSITNLLPSAASDPAVKQDVILFGKNIGKELSLAGSKAVSDPEFYNAVENALQKTMTQATTQAFKESLPKIKKQITTIAAFGGEINRGDRGQRISLSRASQQKAFGYERGMISYKAQTLTSQLQKQGITQGQQPFANSPQFVPKIDLGGPSASNLNINPSQVNRLISGQPGLPQLTEQQIKARNEKALARIKRNSEELANRAIASTAKAAGTQSPSKRTIPIGEDIARGLEVGMANRKDDVALAGSQLSQAATGGTSRRVASRPQGAPGFIAGNTPRTGIALSTLNSAYEENQMRDAVRKQQQQMTISSQRMNSLNKAFMSGTFALSALSGVASMAGGNLGKFSEILFQISGPMFALSSVLQLFTGQKIIGLISKFKVGFGIASAALIAGVVAIKLVNSAREKEKMAIEGVGRAANLTSKQIEKLGGALNFTPVKSNLEFAKAQVPGLSPQTSRQVEELTKILKEDKEFQNQVKTLEKATEEQADIIFKSISVRLAGQGATTEAIQNYVYALQQEAKRLDLSFDFKSIDLTTTKGQAGLQSSVDKLLNDYQAAFNKGYTKKQSFVTDPSGNGSIIKKEVVELSKELKTNLFTTANTFSSLFMGIETQLATGKINADQFNQSFNKISNSIKEMPKAEGMLVLSKMLKTMPSELAQSASKITNLSKQFKVLEAAMLGVYITEGMINTLTVKDGDSGNQLAQGRIERFLNKKIAEAKLAKEIAGKIFADLYRDPDSDSDDEKKDPLKEKIIAIQNQTKSYIILRNAKIDEKTATELSNDAEIASLIIKNKSSKLLPKIIAQVKEYTKALKRQADTENKYMSAPDKFKEQLKKAQAQATLREKLIDMEFAPRIKTENDALKTQEKNLQNVNDAINKINESEIKPVQARINANNFALEKISLQEDEINEKYNKQIDALEKIATINQDIANTQKQRISIADALTRGDISAAASAVQELRAQQAESAVNKQRDTLTTSRDSKLSALGRLAIEKQNKELQLQINTIEREKLLTLETQKETIEKSIETTNRNIKSLELQVDTLKDGALYSGKTKQDIDDLDTLIEAAETAGIKFNDVLLKQAGNAALLAKSLNDALTAQQNLSNFTGANNSGNNTSTGPFPYVSDYAAASLAKTVPKFKPEIIKSPAPTALKFKPEIIKPLGIYNPLSGTYSPRMYGGLVPKYMARGGAVGSDTVPSMLTPGEFIMNRRATEQFGPMLSMLNESKYPSMIGNKNTSQVPINNISTSTSDNSTAVYNYNLGFSINGANANANDIARAVMKEIKNVDSQRVRGQR